METKNIRLILSLNFFLLVLSILSSAFCSYCSSFCGGLGFPWLIPGMTFAVIQGYKIKTLGKPRSGFFKFTYWIFFTLTLIYFLYWGGLALLLFNLPKGTVI